MIVTKSFVFNCPTKASISNASLDIKPGQKGSKKMNLKELENKIELLNEDTNDINGILDHAIYELLSLNIEKASNLISVLKGAKAISDNATRSIEGILHDFMEDRTKGDEGNDELQRINEEAR